MPFAIAGGGPGDYFGAAIANACRFNDDDSAYLTFTPSSTGSRATWTFSAWVKRGNLALTAGLFGAGTDNSANRSLLWFQSDDALIFQQGSSLLRTTDAVFRDPAAYLHIVCVIENGHGTPSERVRLYANGVRLTTTGSGDPGSTFMNLSGTPMFIARRNMGSVGELFDGYFAETIFVDGQALEPGSFGSVHPITGQWVPTTYTGSYGTNGFRMDFANAADLGNDVSGNNNDWTSSGLATNDQVPDTPTNNYATWNPFARVSDPTYEDGNLVAVTPTTSAYRTTVSSIGAASGKYVCELTFTGTLADTFIGVTTQSFYENSIRGSNGSGGGIGYRVNGQKEIDSVITTYGASWTSANRIRIEMDLDAEQVEFFKDNVSQGTISFPASMSGKEVFFSASLRGLSGTVTYTADFGQHGFVDTPTAGFKALTARNLTDPIILKPSKYFNTKLYTGNGSAGNAQTGLGFQPDLVWIKSRDEGTTSYTGDHKLWDAVRGTIKSLESDTPDAEATESTGLTAFGSDGFTVGALDQVNFSGDAFVAWCWKESALPGFDIVQYSGDNTANRNIGHSLGVAPDFALVKRLDASEDWFAWHAGLTGNDYFLKLNENIGQSNTSSPFGTGNWSSTQFMVDNDATNNANASGTDNYIAYLWTAVEGFSKFGLYTGNGLADGPFMWCGFRPAFVLVKRADAGNSWTIRDAAREAVNPADNEIYPNTSEVEAVDSAADVDLLASGFKVRTTSPFNTNGSPYIFAAFAEAPFKYARAR